MTLDQRIAKNAEDVLLACEGVATLAKLGEWEMANAVLACIGRVKAGEKIDRSDREAVAKLPPDFSEPRPVVGP
jgi:hypothetical protein